MGLFDKMTEPEFLKEDSCLDTQLRQLMQLQKEPLPKNIAEQLNEEIRILKAGSVGEKQILFELRNSHIPMFVMRDLYLKDGDLSAQIDFLIITRKLNFLVECKNLYGNIKIDSKGSFIRTTYWNGRYHKEGIYSPVTQNERHLDLFKAIRAKEKSGFSQKIFSSSFDKFNKSIVVLANPKTILDDSEADEKIRSQVIRADQLITYIKGQIAASRELSSNDKEMRGLAEKILQHHTPTHVDYAQAFLNRAKLSSPARKASPAKAKTKQNIEVRHKNASMKDASGVPVCSRCGSPMVKRIAKKGDNKGNEFYGCTSYPKCRNIVSI